MTPNPGDFVRFYLFCFGAKRPATGCIITSPSPVPGTVTIEYQVALPAPSQIEPTYHRVYPANGVFKGIVTIPVTRVEEIQAGQLTLEPPPQTPQQLTLFPL